MDSKKYLMFPGEIYSEKIRPILCHEHSWSSKRLFTLKIGWKIYSYYVNYFVPPIMKNFPWIPTYYITYRFLEFLYKVYNNQHLWDSHARVKNTHPIMYICGFINHFLIWNEWTRFFSLKGTVGVLSLKKAGICYLLYIVVTYILKLHSLIQQLQN